MLEAVKNKRPFAQSFEDLEVYKRAFEISITLHKVSLDFPKIEQYALADQLRRASKSICANIAEGFSKQSASKPEFGRFIGIAVGSAGEMQVWLSFAFRLGYISEDSVLEWKKEYLTIIKMLQSLKNNSNN